MDLYEKIKELAVQKHVSIRQIEEHFGWGNGVINRWRNSKPSVDKVQAVADYFNVSVDYLLGREKHWDFTIENYPIEVNLKKYYSFSDDASITYEINLKFKESDIPHNILQALHISKHTVANKLNKEFPRYSEIVETRAVEMLIDELQLNTNFEIKRIAQEPRFSPELDQAIEHAEAYEGTPLTDEDKAILRGVIAGYLKTKNEKK